MFAGSVLAIGAHLDDVVMGLGGLIAQFAERGYAATILTLTSGELAGEPELREQEDEMAVHHLGARVVFGRLPDGSVSEKEAICAIIDAIGEHEPTIVFAHDPCDTHQDHMNVGRAAAVACRAKPNLFYYEGPSTTAFQPACTVDVSTTWHRKLEALAKHQSQVSSRRLLEWVHATARYRAWPAHAGAPCESFRVEHAELELFVDRPERRTLPVVTGECLYEAG